MNKVEVSTDGGATYQEAELAGPVLPKAHTRFYLPWTWNGEETVLQSRCLDERGQLQPTEAEYAQYWNCTAPGSLDTHLCYAAWRSSYSSRASIGV